MSHYGYYCDFSGKNGFSGRFCAKKWPSSQFFDLKFWLHLNEPYSNTSLHFHGIWRVKIFGPVLVRTPYFHVWSTCQLSAVIVASECQLHSFTKQTTTKYQSTNQEPHPHIVRSALFCYLLPVVSSNSHSMVSSANWKQGNEMCWHQTKTHCWHRTAWVGNQNSQIPITHRACFSLLSSLSILSIELFVWKGGRKIRGLAPIFDMYKKVGKSDYHSVLLDRHGAGSHLGHFPLY